MHPIEFTWYKAIVLLASAMAIGVGILNIVYFNKIRLNNNCKDISSSEATTALWLNIILVILAGILFFWSLFRLIFSGAPEKEIVNKTYNTHYHSPEPSTYSPPLEMPGEVGQVSESFPAPAIPIPSSPSTPMPATSTVYTSPSLTANVVGARTESGIAQGQKYW